MYTMRNGRYIRRPQGNYVPLRRRKKRRQARRSLIWMPILVAACAYVIINVLVAFSFNDVARWLGVVDVDRYRRLAIWGTVLTAIVAVARILKTRAKQGE